MKKPVCYNGIALHPAAQEKLRAHFTVTTEESGPEGMEAALVYGVPGGWLGKEARGMRKIACHLCGEEAGSWARSQGIEVFESTVLWRTVAEHTVALLLAAARNIVPSDGDVRRGEWNNHVDLKIKHAGRTLFGGTAGILGMGRIGRYLPGMLGGFGMELLYHDIVRLSPREEKEMGVEYVELEELLKRSGFLIPLLPLDASTTGFLDRRLFARMKKGAILVNTARAGIIDEEAFREAVEQGTISAAGLDVLWREGEPQPDWIAGNPRITLSPHLGGSTLECDMELVDALINS